MTAEAAVEWERPEQVPPDENDPRIQAALADLRERILQHYPAATFDSHLSPEGDLIWLDVIADVDDLDEVTDVVLARVGDLQVEEGIPVGVMGRWPKERLAEYYRQLKVKSTAERNDATTQSAVAGSDTT